MAAGARAVSATPNQAEAETPETTVAAKSATESATESGAESAAVEKLRAATAISSKPFDDYLLKSRWLPTTPQQRYNGAPQRSPSWSKMVTADEAPAAERAAAELAAAELAAAERVAATNPKIVKKRRTCSKRSSSPAEQQAAELAAAEKAAEEKAAAETVAAETAEAERHAASKAAAVGLLQPEAAAVSASSKRSSSPIEQQFTNAASQLGGPQLAVRMTGEP